MVLWLWQWGEQRAGLSARAYAVDGDDCRVHQAHLLVLVDAQLVAAAPAALHGRDLGVGLGTRWQQEAHAAGNEHMPDAVDVEVVLLRLHEGVERYSRRGDHGAREQEEHPALPGGWVAAATADGADGLREKHMHEYVVTHTNTQITHHRRHKSAHIETDRDKQREHRKSDTLYLI